MNIHSLFNYQLWQNNIESQDETAKESSSQKLNTSRNTNPQADANPVPGHASNHRQVALASLDNRNTYKFVRQIDTQKILTRSQSHLIDTVKEYTPQTLFTETLKSGLSYIPGASIVMPLYEMNQIRTQKQLLKQASASYDTVLAPIFNQKFEQADTNMLINLIEAIDMSPFELLSRFASLVKNGKTFVDADTTRLERIKISELQTKLNEPKPKGMNYHEWHEQQQLLADQRNALIFNILSSDPNAAEGFINLLENIDLSQNQSLQNEFKHHLHNIQGRPAPLERDSNNRPDQAHAIQPSKIRQQVISERSIMALKNKGGSQ